MKVQEACTRPAVCCAAETTVAEAAHLMREQHVGALIVTKGAKQGDKPLGILTDRDIALSIVAPELDARTITAGDIAQRELVTAQEDDDLFAALKRMRSKGVRRLPVVDAHGKAVGLLALDDIVEVLVDEMNTIVKLVAREQSRELATRQ
jgi:CBS domain-containing protein